jgi:ElaB/YqjD/DUF883 family membrane-anchored ribosome-binding protein
MPTARSKANTGPTTDDIVKQFAQIQDDIAELGNQVSRLAAHQGAALHDGARDTVNQAMNGAVSSGRKAFAEARKVEAEFQRIVTDKPITTVAVAAGLGYLIGFLSKRS